jgi:hypothetical protein
VSQLLLVLQGIHSHLFQYTKAHALRERLAVFLERDFNIVDD